MRDFVRTVISFRHLSGASSFSSGKEIHDHRNVQSVGKEVRDVPVVAGGARRGAAQLPALLREGRGGARAVHGPERPIAYIRDGLPALGEVGETMIDGRRMPTVF